MRLIYSSLIFTLLFCTAHVVSAQQPVNPDEEYTIENVFGIKNATNGGLISAVYFRHSRMLANDNLMHLGVELSNTKHPRETRETTFTGSNFIFGKTNYLISIRPTYGREKIFFKKAPQQGVRISGMVAIGPSIGLEAPYYIDLGNRSEQYDPSRHGRNEIVGNAGPFRGLFESQLVLGGFFKASMTFETNSTKNRVFGVEAGFQIESFTRDIEIIPVATNRNTFTAAFIALYFGKRR